MKKFLLKAISISLVFTLCIALFAGCGGKKSVAKTNSDGSFDLSTLTPFKASYVKTENGRKVIYHNGVPYLYYAMHLRLDHLKSSTSEEFALEMYDEYAKQVKEDGWDTVIVYIRWQDIYDGEKYDFSVLEFQYNVAKKYDLKIHINWFGYDVCGFGGYMPWQKDDLEKYPPLHGLDGSPVINKKGGYIPDYSQQIYLDEAYDSIQQLCAWLNVNDTDRRTVAIQLENEPDNAEGGNGLWMSQFKNMVNHLNNLGKAVKESPYSMVTYLNLCYAGQNDTADGYNFTERVHKLINQKYIDIVGFDSYTKGTTPREKVIEYGKNLPVLAEFGSCSYSYVGQVNYLLSSGYGLGIYMFVNMPDIYHNDGFYRWQNAVTGIEKRDGTQMIPDNPINTMGNCLELNADEVIAQNKSIIAIRELIASEKTNNIAAFNNTLKNKVSALKLCNGEKITYIYNDESKKYGGSGLCVGAEDGNYYLYSSQTAEYKFETAIKEVTAGTYKNGVWTATETIAVKDNTFTAKPGLAYRVVIK